MSSHKKPWTGAERAAYLAQNSPANCSKCGKTCKGKLGLAIHSKRSHDEWDSARAKNQARVDAKVRKRRKGA